MKALRLLKSAVVKLPLGARARALYWKARKGTLERRDAQRLAETFPLPAAVQEAIGRILPTIRHHWCHPAKPRVLASLIVRDRIQRTVEIGVYTGASFVPQAVAARHVGGIAVGIDPYSAAEAEQTDNPEILNPLRQQLRERDWDAIYAGLLQMLEQQGLGSSSQVLRMPSARAADLIQPGVGLIHIDGNHDYLKVHNDIASYLPKLRPGGYLVLDDIGWPTIRPQYEELKRRMAVVYEAPGAWGCLRHMGS